MSDTKGPYRVTKADLDDWYIVQGPTMVFGSHGWMTLSEASILSDRLNAAYAAGQKSDAELIQSWFALNAIFDKDTIQPKSKGYTPTI